MLLFALLKGEVEPNAVCGEACVDPPKIDAVLVLLLPTVPPNIFPAGFGAGTEPNRFPVDAAGGLAGVDDGGVDIPKPPNDTDALSTDFEPKTFVPAVG